MKFGTSCFVGFFFFFELKILNEQLHMNMILKWLIALTAFAYHATSPHENGNPDPVFPNSFHTQIFWLDNISFQALDVLYLDQRNDCKE